MLEARLGGKIESRASKVDEGRSEGRSLQAEDAAPVEIETSLAVAEEPEAAEAAPDELPPVEGLAGRIPPEVRAALTELFRAEWTTVRRLRPTDVKPD